MSAFYVNFRSLYSLSKVPISHISTDGQDTVRTHLQYGVDTRRVSVFITYILSVVR
jgi:hypothetical protein